MHPDSPPPAGPSGPGPALPRLGPRPLTAHLSLALQAWMSCEAGWLGWKGGSPSWKPAQNQSQSQNLTQAAQALNAHPENAVRAALAREGRARMARLLDGISRYRHHPYRRALADPPVVWADGTSRLLDYGHGQGRPLLVVPSLVNRWYVLDLTPEISLLRWLATQGWRPLCVDWGRPGPLERGWGMDDYIGLRLVDVLRFAAAEGPVPVLGYCMGGTMAVALAALMPESVAALALLAAPWDFHTDADAKAAGARLADWHRALAPALGHWGELPTDLLQACFMALDPLLALRKFSTFTPTMAASPRGVAFVAVEDWLNDGVPLSAPVTAETLGGWYGENLPGAGRWQVTGQPIEPARLPIPTLALIPADDRIVPPANAAALANQLPACTRLRPALGHIGMVVGGRANKHVWQPLAAWLNAHTPM